VHIGCVVSAFQPAAVTPHRETMRRGDQWRLVNGLVGFLLPFSIKVVFLCEIGTESNADIGKSRGMFLAVGAGILQYVQRRWF
jgi:hypothetical protein